MLDCSERDRYLDRDRDREIGTLLRTIFEKLGTLGSSFLKRDVRGFT